MNVCSQRFGGLVITSFWSRFKKITEIYKYIYIYKTFTLTENYISPSLSKLHVQLTSTPTGTAENEIYTPLNFLFIEVETLQQYWTWLTGGSLRGKVWC